MFIGTVKKKNTDLGGQIFTGAKEGQVNPWIEKYIFPGGYIPSLRETVWLLPEYDFRLLHAESLRLHYALTLDRWYQNYINHKKFVIEKFGNRFFRSGVYICKPVPMTS